MTTAGATRRRTGNEIAIIGMAGRFPRAKGIVEFWENLRAGIECSTEITADDLRAAGVDPAVLADPNYVKRVFALEEAEHFDAEYFGYNPEEAALLDPQHRILLETAVAALEHAGYDPDRYPGLIGAYAGVGRNSYFLNAVEKRPELFESAGDYHMLLGVERDFATTHISYRLNLRGPAITVLTACSTSGVALHLASQSLRAGDCDIALAGGAKVIVPNRVGYTYVEGGPLAPDGRVRAFDADANGMVRGSGAAMLVLKRLDDATADGDSIYGVVLGSAVNNDGSDKIGFTAPSVTQQAAVIAEALAASGITADDISYVETHGTGTILGDPIEIAGLTEAFRRTTNRTGFCHIGSVKTNIGHLDAGAMGAGIIKTLLAFRHQVLPPSLNFTRANPQLDLERSPFRVAASLTPWPRPTAPRRAGVSSFGLGGTNAHVVIEEPPELPASSSSRARQLLVLSAKTYAALEAATDNLAAHLSANPEQSIADVAYTLQLGRRELSHRRVVVAGDAREAAELLRARDARQVTTQTRGAASTSVIFMFPGGGAQYPGMAAGLYAAEPGFRESIQRCTAVVDANTRAAIERFVGATDSSAAPDPVLERPSLALPALFAVEFALAEMWARWGVTPSAMIGHSLGEYAAACLAGVFSLDHAMHLVVRRGQLFERLAAGRMASVPLSEAELRPMLDDRLSIAAINKPGQCVASGSIEAIDELIARLSAKGIESTRLHISVAAHSHLVDPILAEFGDVISGIPLSAPKIPFISNVTGTWITDAEATDPRYWVRQLRQTVRFADGVATALGDASRVLLEVGPGQTLSTFARQHPDRASTTPVVASTRHPQESLDDDSVALQALGRLWLSGVPVDWGALHEGEQRRRVELPTYPFQRQRYSLVDERHLEVGSGRLEAGASFKPPTSSLQPPASSKPPTSNLQPPASRKERLVVELRRIIEELSGMPSARLDANATFLELGFDSLFLARANSAFKKRFNARLTTRHLLEKTPTLTALAAWLDAELPADAFAAVAPDVVPAAAPASVAPSNAATASALENLITQQMQLMQAQLAALRGLSAAPAAAPATPAVPAGPASPDKTSPWQPVSKRASDTTLTAAQQAFIAALIDRVTQRTPKSKALTQDNRARLSDPRTVQGFRKQWKQMVYPIVSDRAKGSKIWDIDGNEYIDLVNGYGATFFGHSPDFILDAVREQLDKSVAIGPQTTLAGEVATLICEMTGMERAAFCNTGSEAVLAAIRTARTVTGKTKLAAFAGHYHGIFDEVLVKGVGSGAERAAAPIAPGIPANKVEDVVVLEYGNLESLDVIRRHAGELALVLVEPVRSRNLDHQPREFLQALRKLTEELGIPLLFDEMITGFRSHPGGAQALFGVRADLATYGKIIGGEFPIGIVTGSKQYLDALDGGAWSYADDSAPEADMTWFAGTFVRHPLALAASRAVLRRLKAEGPQLQEGLNRRTSAFVKELNDHFKATNAPIHVEHFASAFIVTFTTYQEYSPLVYYELHTRGVYAYDGRPGFFTLAHSDADIARVATAIKDSVAALQNVGLLAGGPVRRAGEPFEIPLTEGQQEIWLATRFGDDASRAFNLAATLRLRGPLRVDALREALRQIVRRHESLRAIPNDDGLTQRVLPEMAVELALSDLSNLAEPEREKRLAELKHAEVATPFDLSKGPLVRATLITLGADDHFFIFGAHHIVCDGWSCGILLRELGRIYEAECTGRAADLAAPMQLSEFVRVSNENRESRERAEAEAYWLDQYAGVLPVLELPTDRSRPARRGFRAMRITKPLDPQFVARMRRLAAAQGSTLFSTLLSGFGALLNRLSGQDDVVVGFSLAEQSALDRDLVAHGVKFLPLRLRPRGDTPFAEFLGSVRTKVLDAVENQNLAFGGLIRKLKVPRNPSRIPLMSVAFNLDPSERGLQIHDLATTVGSVPRVYENFDIFFNVVEKGEDQLELQCTFNVDLFDEATMWRRLSQFVVLMDGAATTPTEPIGQLPILSDEDRRVLAGERRLGGGSEGQTLTQLFERQALQDPNAVAVSGSGRSLTYRELDQRANQLAHRLRAAGCGEETLVGLLLDRSVDLVVGVLGILKAGGAYVPVDASNPPDRVATIFDDAAVRIVVTESRLAGHVPRRVGTVVALDGDAAALSALPTTAPDAVTSAASAAYVIYTSGSTGAPKGVVVTHHNVVRLFQTTRPAFQLGPKDVWTLFHSIAFDFSVWELWGALLFGGRVVVVPQDVTRNPEWFHRLLAAESVTVLNQTPSAFRTLSQYDSSLVGESGLSLRYVVFGGEALTLESLRAWITRHGDARPQLINMYGITETTVHTTYRRIFTADLDAGLGSVIGEPLPDLTIQILDEHRRPVPIGVAGEIYVGGAGVARGYLNRPELTEERFLPDPSSSAPGARLYRSGDQARWLANGDIEYLGRLDHQVKIRGFRIELGEVEGVLRRQGDVRDVAVVAHDDGDGTKSLLAYVVPKGSGGGAEGSARQKQIAVWHDEWTAMYESGQRTLKQSGDGGGHLDDRAILHQVSAQGDFEQEWQEFQGQTLARIRALRPRRVIDIGCGTGQVLLQIAPECESYIGTDFAELAVMEVRRQLANRAQLLPNVSVRRQPADDFSGVEPGTVDTVILNSVIHYFPDVLYLTRVLEGAVRCLRPGGRIYIGDVQSLALLGPHHLSEQLARFRPERALSECRRVVEHRMEIEDELVIDPGFFEALKTRLPGVAHVEFHHRRGRADNETTRFHYDVIIHLDPVDANAIDVSWTPWIKSGHTLSSLRALLQGTDAPAVLALSAVPNERTVRSVAAWRSLNAPGAPATVGVLRDAVARLDAGCHPEDFWALENDTPYRVDVRWSASAVVGGFDVLLVRRDQAPRAVRGPSLGVDVAWPTGYTNNPSWKRDTEHLPSVLREYAREHLPEHMVPGAFVLLVHLPLTANGKLDVAALPAPDRARAASVRSTEPRTDAERAVAAVWSEVLRLDRIGAQDDFFELGGHSLLAVQVIVKLRERLHVDISLGSLFEVPTVEQLARRIEALQYVRAGGAADSAGAMEEVEL